MSGPEVNETQEQEQFSPEVFNASPPDEDQGEEEESSADMYEDRVDAAITGVMEEDEDNAS